MRREQEGKTVNLIPISAMQDMHQFTEAFIIILMRRQPVMQKEARHCLKLLKEQGIDPTDLDLPVAFDIEEKAVFQTGRRNVTAVTTTFCDEIKKAGFEPMVYSGASALRNYFEYSKIREYKIWVAHYTKASAPAIPFSYDMWQYTSRAVINGANTGMGYCDLNYYLVDKNYKE